MRCPYCDSTSVREMKKKTSLNYNKFYCRGCGRQFNERTGTDLNFIEYPTEVVILTVSYYLCAELSLDDVVDLMALRGFHMSHQTVHNWVHLFGAKLNLRRRSKRRRKVGKKWNVSATYIKIEGRWCYFYCAIDKSGNPVDVMLSNVCNQEIKKKFLSQCEQTAGLKPIEIATEKNNSHYASIESSFPEMFSRSVKYKENVVGSSSKNTKPGSSKVETV